MSRTHPYDSRSLNGELRAFDERPVSLLLVDVDRFTSVNDRFGHEAGDQLIAEIQPLLANVGGTKIHVIHREADEFAVFLPEADVAAALATADRIRAAVGGHRVVLADGEVSVTVSIGVAERHPVEGETAWLERAERALVLAKQGGRNRVVSAP